MSYHIPHKLVSVSISDGYIKYGLNDGDTEFRNDLVEITETLLDSLT
jgi:hypothetical protein